MQALNNLNRVEPERFVLGSHFHFLYFWQNFYDSVQQCGSGQMALDKTAAENINVYINLNSPNDKSLSKKILHKVPQKENRINKVK